MSDLFVIARAPQRPHALGDPLPTNGATSVIYSAESQPSIIPRSSPYLYLSPTAHAVPHPSLSLERSPTPSNRSDSDSFPVRLDRYSRTVMALPSAPVEPAMDLDKLSYDIFSILESKFLFGYDDPPNLLLSAAAFRDGCPRSLRLPAASDGRVRILSIDGGGHPADALLAAASLARLESSLSRLSGDPSARVADFFDVATGSGAGGVLAAMLFSRGPNGRPLQSAADALRLLLARSGRSSFVATRGGPLAWGRSQRAAEVLRKLFGDATLQDTVKPLLVPCFDLTTGAPFLFSRVDAMEGSSYDFRLREVCAATCAAGTAPVELRSVDGRTRIVAIGGGVAMGNPAAAAITHVLNNKREFPFADRMKDIMVLSLGSTPAGGIGKEVNLRMRGSLPSQAKLVRIAGEGVDDVVRISSSASLCILLRLCFFHSLRINHLLPPHYCIRLLKLEFKKF